MNTTFAISKWSLVEGSREIKVFLEELKNSSLARSLFEKPKYIKLGLIAQEVPNPNYTKYCLRP